MTKNYQQGSGAIIVGMIIALFAVGGGAYYAGTKTVKVPEPEATTAPITSGDSEVVGVKTYHHSKYGYALSYPKTFFAFEWPSLQKGERPYLVDTIGAKDGVLFTTHDLLNEGSEAPSYLNSPWFRVTRETGSAWVLGSNTVDDFWSKLSKTDEKGNIVNVFVKKESINGVDFIVFNQKNWDTVSQSYFLSLQALCVYNGNFFWIRSSEQVDQDSFYSIIRSFSFNDLASAQSQTYTDSSFGFFLSYPAFWIVSVDANEVIRLKNPNFSAELVSVRKSSGSVSDSSGKFGAITIAYKNNQWVRQEPNESDGGVIEQSFSPAIYTDSGLPIFDGAVKGHGWGSYTYIVALSRTKFLVVSGPDNTPAGVYPYDPANDPTLAIVKTISVK